MHNRKLLALASLAGLIFSTNVWADALTKATNAAAALAWGQPSAKFTTSITVSSQGSEEFMQGSHQVVTQKDGIMRPAPILTHDNVHDLIPAGFELTFDPSVAGKKWMAPKMLALQNPTSDPASLVAAPITIGATYDTKTNLPGPGFVSTGWDHRTCKYVGKFSILSMTLEYKKFGSDPDAVWGAHPTQWTATWTAGCSEDTLAKGTSTGRVNFSDTKKDGVFTPPPSDSTGTGTGGGGGGTGTGGGTGGTTPPPTTTTPPDVTIALPASVFATPVTISNNESTQVDFSILTANAFKSDVTLSAFSEPEGLNVSVTPALIPAPGSGSASVRISAGPETFPQDYRVFVLAHANDKTYLASFVVTVGCNPPFILGTDQPAGTSVRRGDLAHLSVKASGGGPYHYQWYIGHAGQTLFPMPSGNTAAVTTPVISDNTEFWVRVSNACGSADSQTTTVTMLKSTTNGRFH